MATGVACRILKAYDRSPSPIVLPVFNGKRGNPVLFDRRLFGRLDSLSADTGARVLFQEFAGHILKVPVPDPSIHFDIDTEQDYRTLLTMEQEAPDMQKQISSHLT